MEKIILFALCDKDSQVLSNYLMNIDEKDCCKYIVNELIHIYSDITDAMQRATFESFVRASQFVRVGTIDPLTHEMSADYNVLLDFKDFNFIKENNDEEVKS